MLEAVQVESKKRIVNPAEFARVLEKVDLLGRSKKIFEKVKSIFEPPKEKFLPTKLILTIALLGLLMAISSPVVAHEIVDGSTSDQQRSSSIEENRDAYFETGYAEIDVPGSLEVNIPEVLNNGEYSMAVTVNLYDGTFTIFRLPGDGTQEEVFRTYVLVGQRLQRVVVGTPSIYLAEHPDQFSTWRDGGRYDRSNAVFSDRYGLRHTLTPTIVAELNAFARIDGFGGLPVKTDVALIRVLTNNGPSYANSQYTFHEVPPLEGNDHYETRRQLLSEADENGMPVDNPYWSHGCVNVEPNVWLQVKTILQNEMDANGKVIVIFSTPGQNQSNHIRNTEFSGFNDLFFSDNFNDQADEVDPTRVFHESEEGESIDSESTASGIQDTQSSDNEHVTQGSNTFLSSWYENESFRNFSDSSRAPEEIRNLPLFVKKLIEAFIESGEVNTRQTREQLYVQADSLWRYAFPDGNFQPTSRSIIQQDIFNTYEFYGTLSSWTIWDVWQKWQNDIPVPDSETNS